MVECPVCGKWLKTPFALNGHMRLKGDNEHRYYLEKQEMRIPKKDDTKTGEQFRDLISLIKQQKQQLSENNDDIRSLQKQIKELNNKFNTRQTKAIIPLEVKTSTPIKEEKKIPTLAETLKNYNTFDNVLEYVDHWRVLEILNNDPNLSLSKRLELKDKASKHWLRH